MGSLPLPLGASSIWHLAHGRLAHTGNASCGRLCNPPSGTSAEPQTTQRSKAQGSTDYGMDHGCYLPTYVLRKNPKIIRLQCDVPTVSILQSLFPTRWTREQLSGTPVQLCRSLIGRLFSCELLHKRTDFRVCTVSFAIRCLSALLQLRRRHLWAG